MFVIWCILILASVTTLCFVNTVPFSFSIVVLPDTQQYVENNYNRKMFPAQTAWIAGNKEELNIQFVLHLGDIVQTNAVEEWKWASRSYEMLDETKIPYALTVGNHDFGTLSDVAARNTTRFNAYFGPERFKNEQWYGGHYGEGNENNYTFFDVNDLEFMVLHLEFGPRDKVLEWANELVSSYPEKRVVVVTHSYLCHDDLRVGDPARDLESDDCWTPYNYVGQYVLEANDGEEMWNKLVKLHKNIFLVVSGHTLGDGAGYLISTGDHGNKVHQILTNYQTTGYGWLRILTFVPSKNLVYVVPDTPLRLGGYTDAYNHFTEAGYFDSRLTPRTAGVIGFRLRDDPEHSFVFRYDMN